jgi:hypothetical protein
MNTAITAPAAPVHTFLVDPIVGAPVAVEIATLIPRMMIGTYLGITVDFHTGVELHAFEVTAAAGPVKHCIPVAWFA